MRISGNLFFFLDTHVRHHSHQ